MTRLIRYAAVVLWSATSLTPWACFAQSSSESTAAQSGAAGSSAAATRQAQDGAAAATSDVKKKKVWTNEDVGSLSGPVSVVGNSKNSGKSTADGAPADAQYIANAKKQLEKFESQLDDTKKQLTALEDFEQGKAPEPTGYQLGKGYNRVPVDQQIASLEEKQRQLQGKISDLLDEARKKGVLPGQLR